jgi:hypothetical protein
MKIKYFQGACRMSQLGRLVFIAYLALYIAFLRFSFLDSQHCYAPKVTHDRYLACFRL